MSNLNITTSKADKDRAHIKADTVLNTLKTKTPQEINQYIDTNVTDLDSAKEVLKILTKVVAYLTRSV